MEAATGLRDTPANDTFDLYEFEYVDDDSMARLISNVLYTISALVGVPGNVFVLVSIVTFREMRTISNIYIFNLALADLLFLLGTPFVLTHSFKRTWIFGETMCRIFLSSNGISQFASAAFIGVLSFDRYLAVCRPVQSTEWRTFRYALLISSFAWVMVVIEMTPLFIFGRLLPGEAYPAARQTCMLFLSNDSNASGLDISDEETEDQMRFSQRFFIAYTCTLSYLLPLIAVWFFYANIISRMWARRKHIWGRKKSMRRTTFRVSILGLAIVTSYTLCWLPFWTIQWSIVTERLLFHYPDWLVQFSLYAYTLQYVNSAANPFLYVFMSDAFKRNVMQLLLTASSGYQYRKPRAAVVNEIGETMVFLRSTLTTESILAE